MQKSEPLRSSCALPNITQKLVQAFFDPPLLSSDAQSSVYFADGYRTLWSNGQAMLWNKQQRRLALTAMFMLWVIWLVQYRSEQLGRFSWPHVLAIEMWLVPLGSRMTQEPIAMRVSRIKGKGGDKSRWHCERAHERGLSVQPSHWSVLLHVTTCCNAAIEKRCLVTLWTLNLEPWALKWCGINCFKRSLMFSVVLPKYWGFISLRWIRAYDVVQENGRNKERGSRSFSATLPGLITTRRWRFGLRFCFGLLLLCVLLTDSL